MMTCLQFHARNLLIPEYMGKKWDHTIPKLQELETRGKDKREIISENLLVNVLKCLCNFWGSFIWDRHFKQLICTTFYSLIHFYFWPVLYLVSSVFLEDFKLQRSVPDGYYQNFVTFVQVYICLLWVGLENDFQLCNLSLLDIACPMAFSLYPLQCLGQVPSENCFLLTVNFTLLTWKLLMTHTL